jgi:hypothetical protein
LAARRSPSNAAAIRRQTLHLEAHDDPAHPVARAAARRIEDLAAERAEIEARLPDLPQTTGDREPPKRDELEALLTAVPDLRGFTQVCSPEALRELCEAFELEAVYEKEREEVRLTVVLSAKAAAIAGLLEEEPKRKDPLSGVCSIAGAGFEPATFGL